MTKSCSSKLTALCLVLLVSACTCGCLAQNERLAGRGLHGARSDFAVYYEETATIEVYAKEDVLMEGIQSLLSMDVGEGVAVKSRRGYAILFEKAEAGKSWFSSIDERCASFGLDEKEIESLANSIEQRKKESVIWLQDGRVLRIELMDDAGKDKK